MSFVLGRAISFMGATGVVSKILNVYILMLAITRRLNGRSLKHPNFDPGAGDDHKKRRGFPATLITVLPLL